MITGTDLVLAPRRELVRTDSAELEPYVQPAPRRAHPVLVAACVVQVLVMILVVAYVLLS